MDKSVDWFQFPKDDYLTGLLSWLGHPYPLEIGRRLSRAVHKQQPGADLLAMICLDRPDLQTFSQPGGRVSQVTAVFTLRLLICDARARPWWQKAAVTVDGRKLDRQPPALTLDYRLLESQPLDPDGKILAERLRAGIWLERSQLMVPWRASQERLVELGARSSPLGLRWPEESVLGGISGSVEAELSAAAGGTQRLSGARIRPDTCACDAAAADSLFAHWLRLTEHFGPPQESAPGQEYRWHLGKVHLLLTQTGAQAQEQPASLIQLIPAPTD